MKRFIKYKFVLFSFLLVSFTRLFAQYGTLAEVKNVDFELVNDKVIITYDLYYATSKEVFDVEVDIYNSAHYKIDAQTFEGEFTNVKRGRNKKITWYIAEDFTNFEDNIYVIVTAHHKNYKLYPEVSRLDAIWKSTLWPGWGSAQTQLNNGNYVKGLFGYGSLIGSIYLYDNYKKNLRIANNSNEGSEAYTKYSTRSDIYKISTYVALGSAGLMWLWDYSEILFKPNKSKKIKLDFETNAFDNSLYPMLSLKLNL